MEKRKSDFNGSFWLIAAAALLFFAALAYLFPNTGDDWAWGSIIGEQRLDSWFDNYNGRYAGNLLVMALTRSKLLTVIAMAVSFCAACLIPAVYSSSGKPVTPVFSILLFLVMPKMIFSQAIVWTAGFSNYVPPIIIAELYILIEKDIFEDALRSPARLSAPLTVISGFIGSLFMENVSIFYVALAVATAVISYIRFKKIRAEQIGFFIGSVSGCLLMFSNSAYSSIASGNDGYRDAATSLASLYDIASSHLYTIFDNLIISNRLMCVIVAVPTAAIAIKYLRKNENSKNLLAVRILLSVNIISVFVLCIKGYVKDALSLTPFNRYAAYYKLIMFAIACLYLASLTLILIICIKKERRLKLLFPLFCVPIISAPLLVVNPIGPRCFFPAYALLMMFAAELFDCALPLISVADAEFKHAERGLTCVAAGIMIFYLTVFSSIHSYDVKRNEFAKLQSDNGEKTVVICELPNNSYLWTSEPKKEPWAKRYKLFYGLKEDVNFRFVDRKEFDRILNEYKLGA
ncbi:MAG: DUF6056 family protein [Acutalibacteraceae bacterium]